MKWLNGYRIRLVSVGFVAAIVLGGGRAKADFTFGQPIQIGLPIWSPGDDPQGCCFSGDGLELYFSSLRPGGFGRKDIWVATRERSDAPWGEPVNLGPPVNDERSQIETAISPDGLELYFGDWDDWNIRVCKRSSKDAPWSIPEFLGPPVGLGIEAGVKLSADGLSLYFASERSGGYGGLDIWVSTRATTADPWGEPANLGPNVNSAASDAYPSISSDGRVLFFNSNRPGSYHPNGNDIWMTKRATESDPWGPPVNCDAINNAPTLSGSWRVYPAISPDGSVLYFERSMDMWQSTITPIVDFNGDGKVDTADLVMLIDAWRTNDTLYDIGPMPWGDGVVDKADLEVLMSYLGQELEDPTLVAHWKMDETEGSTAHDSSGDKDGTLNGNPIWQAMGGKIDGAIQLDGIDDYVSTPYVLNPAEGAFSVFAWIKGGAPGQVIVSQVGGANWLLADSSAGKLMTSLSAPAGRVAPPPLVSEFVITDGLWHRIGFVWDGAQRMLYVDDVEVAKDTQTGLSGSNSGLHIGAGKALEPGSFWSGLIDDVRIYNRAVTP